LAYRESLRDILLVNELVHRERAVGQHSVKRLEAGGTRPARDTQTNQSDTGDAAHDGAYTTDLCAKQQANHNRRPSEQNHERQLQELCSLRFLDRDQR